MLANFMGKRRSPSNSTQNSGPENMFYFFEKIFFASPGKFSLFKDILSLFIEGGPPSGPEVLLRKCVEKVEFSEWRGLRIL